MLPIAELDDEVLALASLPSLVNLLRYGSVHKVDTGMLADVVDGFIARACIALPHGLRGLTDEAAIDVLKRLIGADQTIRLLQSDDHLAFWFEALEDGATSESSHPLLAGRCCRILIKQGRWPGERAARQLALKRCVGTPRIAADVVRAGDVGRSRA